MTLQVVKSRPAWRFRLLASTAYFAITPFHRLFRVSRNDPFVRAHQSLALAMLLLPFLIVSMWLLHLAIEVYLVRSHPVFATQYRPESALRIASIAGLGLWGLGSSVGVVAALSGSTLSLPAFGRLSRCSRYVRVASIGNAIAIALVALIAGLAIHAGMLTREDVTPAPVYFLYDNEGFEFLGTWGPKLFCYPAARVATERWGAKSVVVAPISAENVWTAITHGRLVVLISHGKGGTICLSDGQFILPVSIGTHGHDLQFVYISACYAGEKASEWERKFAPAKIVTYDRLSSPLEHLWWLWFDAPDLLREVR